MAVGGIDNMFNNTNTAWYLKSVDDRHNGALEAVGPDRCSLTLTQCQPWPWRVEERPDTITARCR
jgi:hypothetical protein